jgi:hypothetical protein
VGKCTAMKNAEQKQEEKRKRGEEGLEDDILA